MADIYVKSGGGTIGTGSYRGNWTANGTYALGDRVCGVAVSDYWIFECTTAGTANTGEPAWIKTAGSTTTDNTAIWTARVPADWANATLNLSKALVNATTSGDRIFVKYDDAFILTASTTFTAANNIAVIAVSSTDYTTGTNWTPAVMDGTTGYIGHSTTAFSITLNGAFKCYWYGLCFRTTGAGNNPTIIACSSDNGHFEFESCFFKLDSGSSGYFQFGSVNNDQNHYIKATNCTFSVTNVNHAIRLAATTEIYGGSISIVSGNLTNAFLLNNFGEGGDRIVSGVNLSGIGSTANILANITSGAARLRLDNCRLPATWTGTWLFTQTSANKSGGAITAFNCSTGDTHYEFAYADSFGVLTAVTTPYFDVGAKYDGTNAVCWKIVTTANCSYYTPFVSPWIEKYHSGTSTITPYLEILRNDSITAFNDDEVWGEFSIQATSGSVLPVFKNDRKSLEASAASQANGAGLTSWTGESGTAWSGKVDSGTSATPAEIGMLRARVCVGAASATVYVDPYIRS